MNWGSVTFAPFLPELPSTSLYATLGSYCSIEVLRDTVAPLDDLTSSWTTAPSRSMRNSSSCVLFARLY